MSRPIYIYEGVTNYLYEGVTLHAYIKDVSHTRMKESCCVHVQIIRVQYTYRGFVLHMCIKESPINACRSMLSTHESPHIYIYEGFDHYIYEGVTLRAYMKDLCYIHI